jgi:hypothetical protein
VLGWQAAGEIPTKFPDFRDPKLAVEIERLLNGLAKYDGHRGISQIRISTGLMGEDNPRVGPLSSPMPGYHETDWLQYCRRMTDLYREKFNSSELEFDLGRLSWMHAKGNVTEKEAVDNFIAELRHKRVMLAFNGLDSESLKLLTNPEPKNGVSQSLRYVAKYRASGGRIGLEAIGPLASQRFRDIGEIAEIIRKLSPHRLVLFYDTAMLIAALRSSRRTEVSKIFGHRANELEGKAIQLIQVVHELQ